MPNRLAAETSPYLLQHADNPVDWYPWGAEAFDQARQQDKPLLLSVGYSSCHWCHVMAHESFEDPAIAALMNELFINVKVDREERPDIDAIYMQAAIAMSGHGGWPMTVFLTPSGAPFFAGTYFPPQDRHGMAGFPTVLRAVEGAYRRQRDDVDRAAQQLTAAMAATVGGASGGDPRAEQLDAAADRLVQHADTRHGGFGGAPKFPHPAAIDLLLRRHRASGDARHLETAVAALDGMARGGIHDHLGGGFHRYAVDAAWAVPHFEKMLYDNAQLASTYLHAHLHTGDERWRRVVEDVVDYLLTEMRLPDGGFASSQDADSPGGEGSYFVWTPAGLREALGDADGELAARAFGVTETGNFEGGATVLAMPVPLHELAASEGLTSGQLDERLASIRARLLTARARRPAPGRDDKVLTSWNALTISALAEAGAALQRPDYLDAARAAADFLLDELRPAGVLLRTWKEGRAKITGFLEDAAFLTAALITLYEAGGEPRYLDEARKLAADALHRYTGDDGLLYDTAGDAAPLVVRPRTIDDNPIPAGQSTLADALLRLSAHTGDAMLHHQALAIITPLADAIERSPLALSALGCAMDRALAPPREVAIVGNADDPRTRDLLAVVHSRWLPDTVLAWGDPAGVPLLADRPLVDGAPAAYVCQNFACRAPVRGAAELAAQLDAPQRRAPAAVGAEAGD